MWALTGRDGWDVKLPRLALAFFLFHRRTSIKSPLHSIDMGRFVTHMLDMLEGVGLSLEQIFR